MPLLDIDAGDDGHELALYIAQYIIPFEESVKKAWTLLAETRKKACAVDIHKRVKAWGKRLDSAIECAFYLFDAEWAKWAHHSLVQILLAVECGLVGEGKLTVDGGEPPFDLGIIQRLWYDSDVCRYFGLPKLSSRHGFTFYVGDSGLDSGHAQAGDHETKLSHIYARAMLFSKHSRLAAVGIRFTDVVAAAMPGPCRITHW